MSGERLTFDPVTEDSSNSPLDVVGTSDGAGIFLLEHAYPTPELDSQYAASADTEGDPLIENRYRNREISMKLRVAEPSDGAATNYATNPSGEVTAIWSNSADYTNTQSQAVTAYAGDYVTKHTYDGSSSDTSLGSISFTFIASGTWVVSCYVYFPAGYDGGNLSITTDGTYAGATETVLASASSAITGSWQRVSTRLAVAAGDRVGTISIRATAGSSVSTGTVYTDALQIESASTATTYFDGDTPGCDWSGTHHASTSTRPANSGPRFLAILDDLQQKAAKITQEGGTLRRTVPDGSSVTFDLLSAKIDIPADKRFNVKKITDVTLTMTAAPFARGAATTLSDNVETTNPCIVFTATGVTGDVPALATLKVDEDQGQDQKFLFWGLQSQYYDSATTAKLFYEAEALTATGAASVTAGTAGSSGGQVIKNTTLTSSLVAMMTTQASGGGSHMTHIGDYQVWARILTPATNTGQVSVALEWSEQDFNRVTRNPSVSLDAGDSRQGNWVLIDLGQIRLSKAASGTSQRWEGRVLASSTVLGDDIEVDCLFFQPLDRAGRVTGVDRAVATTAAVVAYDDFVSSGSLSGTKTTNGITGATNASPISITVTSHGLTTGNTVWIEGVGGNTAANGYWTITSTGTNTFTLNGSTGNGTYTSGGTVSKVGLAAEVGGSWFGTGSTTDFTEFGVALRQGAADSNTQSGRFAILATTAYTTSQVQADFGASPSSPTAAYVRLLVARYSNTTHWVGGGFKWTGSGGKTKITPVIWVMNGTLSEFTAASTDFLPTTKTVSLTVDTTGTAVLSLGPVGGAQQTLITVKTNSALATGGALQTGRIGIYDAYLGSDSATTRYFDNFIATASSSTTVVDNAMFASRSISIRDDRVIRQTSDGVNWGKPGKYEGDYLKIPPAGREARTTRLIVKASRQDPENYGTDGGVDDISAQLTVTPRYLVVPGS